MKTVYLTFRCAGLAMLRSSSMGNIGSENWGNQLEATSLKRSSIRNIRNTRDHLDHRKILWSIFIHKL